MVYNMYIKNDKGVIELEKPLAIDLFCGAGGMSLGFIQEGFDINLACDFDESCIETYTFNHPNTKSEYIIKSDIKEIDNEQEQKGFYRVPIYFEVYTIYTPNKIIHEDLIFTSENRKELVSNLKKLFKIEFYKYFSL